MTATLNDEVAQLRLANAELQRRLGERTVERDEGEAQKAAMTEVLQVINSSPGDLAPVFDAMLERAMRLCEAAFGILRTYDGDRYHAAATHGVPPAYAEFLANTPQQPQPGTIGARIVEGERLVHIVDAMDDELYPSGDPHRIWSAGDVQVDVASKRQTVAQLWAPPPAVSWCVNLRH